MFKTAVVTVAALAALTVSASAQQPNCGASFRTIWEQLEPRGPAAKLSPEQYANVHRTALRAYDACMAGDEQWAKDVFAKIGEQIKKNER